MSYLSSVLEGTNLYAHPPILKMNLSFKLASPGCCVGKLESVILLIFLDSGSNLSSAFVKLKSFNFPPAM